MGGASIFGILVLAALAAVNVHATRRVMDSDEDGFRKKLLLAGIWLVPFFGALATKDVGKVQAQVLADGEAAAREEAPAQVPLGDGHPVDALELLAAFEGLPLIDWTSAHLEHRQDGPVPAALRRAWLLHLRDALGAHYRLDEAEHVVVLSSLDRASVAALVRYVSTTRTRISRVLQDVARFASGVPSVVLVVDDEDTYYRYISAYYPDSGEFGFSGGVFIGHGCPHFVVKRDALQAIEPVIAHELTHSGLAHLALPLWIDEGLAVNTERRLVGATPAPHSPQELHRKHVAFWTPARMQEFWSGESFHRPDDGQLLSYELARILVEEMARDWPAFAAFLQRTSRDDAGEAAARELLEVDLGASVCALFGQPASPDWGPQRAALGIPPPVRACASARPSSA